MNFLHLVPLFLSATLSIAPIVPGSSASNLREDGAAQELVNRVGNFAASTFKFKATVADDKEGKAGGWQEATTQLEFSDARNGALHTWTCSVKVGMPIRSEKGGTVSPDDAAEATAGSANSASDRVMTRRDEWLLADFCAQFGVELERLVNKKPNIFGAKVMQSKYP